MSKTLAEQFVDEQLQQIAEAEASGTLDSRKGIYRRIRSAMDKALLERLAVDLKGNQSRMSERLGLNRSTIRKRCKTLRVNL